MYKKAILPLILTLVSVCAMSFGILFLYDETVIANANESNNIDTFAVTLDNKGGIGGMEMVVATLGMPMPTPIKIPYKFGAVFLGYADTNGVQYYTSNGESAKNWDKNEPAVLSAVWENDAPTYTVNLNFWGGTGGTEMVVATAGKTMPAPITIPQRTNFTFAGYFTEPMGKGTKFYDNLGAPTASVFNGTAPTVIYASWSGTFPSHTITFTNSAESGTIPAALTAQEGSQISLPIPDAPTVTDGYQFVGWFDSSDRMYPYDIMTYEDITLHAVYNSLAKRTITWYKLKETVTSYYEYETAGSTQQYETEKQILTFAGADNRTDSQFLYAFIGWAASKQSNFEANVDQNSNIITNWPSVTTDASYYAVYNVYYLPTVSALPVKIENIKITGAAQTLITAGTASNGDMWYKLDDNGEWNKTLPTAINVGEYTVYYKAVGAMNTETEAGSISVSIVKNNQNAITATLNGSASTSWVFDTSAAAVGVSADPADSADVSYEYSVITDNFASDKIDRKSVV